MPVCHTRQCPAPLDVTLFKPIKTYYVYYQEAMNVRQSNPSAAITKFSFGKHFNTAGKKGSTVGNAVIRFEVYRHTPFYTLRSYRR
jgi:hypothetical protein